MLRYAGAAALVTHVSFAPTVAGLTGEVESLRHIIWIGGNDSGDGPGHDYEALLRRASEQPLPEGDGDDLATLNFSGGTTGAPKAAMLRHRNLMAVARNTIDGFGISGDSVFLNVRPLWPIAQVILMSHLFAGRDGGAASVRSGEICDCSCSNPARRGLRWCRRNWCAASITCAPATSGSNGCRRSMSAARAFRPRCSSARLEIIGPKIGVLYGLTEAPMTCYLPPQASRRAQSGGIGAHHSVGRVLPANMRCESRAPRSRRTDAGRSGEVLIRGGNVMAGYWQDEAATRAALRDGWLHTGDIGEFDDDGNLHIVGRLKDVIRSGSSTIIPKEVEDVIVLHPAVAEVAVIGLPDVEWGEAVTAFVVTKPGMSVAERDLVEHCRARLAGYKKPRSIRFVASLPRSHYGKVLRAQLIAQATK